MPRVPHHQHSFITGEINPRLLGRFDLERMQSAVLTCKNWLITRHGPVVRRPGTRYITNVKDQTKFTRLIPFVASDDFQYALEFGDGYIRIYRDDGQLQDDGVPTEINFSVMTTAKLPNVKYAQQDDTLFLVEPSIPPRRLIRLDTADNLAASWNIPILPLNDGPYLDINDTSVTLTTSVAAANVGDAPITVTASAGNYPFRATDNGNGSNTSTMRRIRVFSGTIWWWGWITAVSDEDALNPGHFRVASVNVRRSFTGQTETTQWRLGAFSDTTGWPSAISLYQDRLWLSGGNLPNRVYASRIGRYTNFSPTDAGSINVTDDTAITTELSSEKQERVQHLSVTARGLAAFTSSGMFIIQGERSGGPVTPSNVTATKQHTRGANDVRPIMVDNDIVHADVSNARLHRARYEFNFDSWKPEDVSVFSDHLLRPGIIDMGYQQEPEPVIWLANSASTGNLLSMTYETDQGVVGWAKHDVGGKVESIAVIRTNNLNRVYMVVKRVVASVERRSVEILTHPFGLGDLSDECICLDGAINDTGVTGTTISGLAHLNGLTTVYVVVNDLTIYGPFTPSGGSLTLPTALAPADKFYVGLAYDSDLVMLPVHVVGGDPVHNNKNRVVMAFPRYREARNLRIGEDLTSTFVIPETAGTVLRNGIATVNVKTQPNVDNGIAFKQAEPWPTMLMSVGMEVEVGGP